MRSCLLTWLSAALTLVLLSARAAEPAPIEGTLVVQPSVLGDLSPRGWPLLLRWSSSEPAPTNVPVVVRSGAGPEIHVVPVAPGTWWLSPEQSRALPAGPATARLGNAEARWDFVDEPQPLSPDWEQEKLWRRIRFALAAGDAAGARALAETWIVKDPAAPRPYVLLGDACAALNLLPEAMNAYGNALRRSDLTHPPQSLAQKASRVWERWLAGMVILDPGPGTNLPPAVPNFASLAEQDAYYAADGAGQWASAATASSEYRTTDYSASRATGTPDVTAYGDDSKAWASKTADGGDEWLEVTFPQPVHAGAVRVRQVYHPGAISRIELFDAVGGALTVFQGSDTNRYVEGRIAWFVTVFARTPQPVQRVRITLDSARVKGWNEIDAVQLVEAAPGSDPNPGGSDTTPPRITQAGFDATRTQFSLTWVSRVGARYAVQRAATVAGSWTTVVEGFPATGALGTSTSFADDFDTGTTWFYRVVAQP
ncbi:MAG: hypothetical protein IT580_00910 [Verrucomicrobiales bacterium]|nr:hypothetical protein [Verrucomicrobiales bacterium]